MNSASPSILTSKKVSEKDLREYLKLCKKEAKNYREQIYQIRSEKEKNEYIRLSSEGTPNVRKIKSLPTVASKYLAASPSPRSHSSPVLKVTPTKTSISREKIGKNIQERIKSTEKIYKAKSPTSCQSSFAKIAEMNNKEEKDEFNMLQERRKSFQNVNEDKSVQSNGGNAFHCSISPIQNQDHKMETFQASFFESVCGNEDIKEQTITFFESESTSPEPQNDPPNPETCSNKKESILKPDRPMEETDLIERVNFLEESMKKSHIVLQKLQQENENLKRSKDGNNFQSSNTNIKEKEEYKETIKKIQNENSLLHFKEKQLHGTMEQLEIENEILRQKLDAINSIQEFQQSIDRNDNRIEVSFYESPNTLPMETNLQTSTPLKTQEHQSVNENDLMNLLNVLNKNTEPEISQAETGFAIAATRKSKPRKHKVKENLEESLISVMKIEIEKFIKHKSDLENQISRHLEARESQERYFEEVLKSIKEENISMKRKNADLKDTLQNYDIQFGAIKRCPVAPTDAPRDFLSEYSNLKFKYDELEKKQLETTFELNNLKISHSTLQKEKNDLDARIDEVENDQRTTQKELNESLALNDKLKLELAESRASQQQLRRKLDTSIQTNSALEKCIKRIEKCYTTVFTQ